MISLIALDCVAFERFFSLVIKTDKQMFKALVMVELLDSEEKEENKGRGMTRSWLKKREELGYYKNIVRELQLEDTVGFKGMMRMNFKHLNEILNLLAPDITPQEVIGENKVISAAEGLPVTL